jgi:hypothetical protein
MTRVGLVTGTRTPPRPATRAGAAGVWPGAALLITAAVAIAALSLVVPWSLAFDPQAWLVWGRDAGRLALDTDSGPSWKPLPVLITTPLAVTGDLAPALWMVFARTAALLALAGAAALAYRLGGAVAGAVAAGVIALSPWWAYNAALGNSEGLLAAVLLWAIVAHLDGHRRWALALATAAALLRPEVWPFLAAYCVWMWRVDPSVRRAVVAIAIAVPALWLGPDVFGIGGAVRASRAARGEASPGSAALEDVPGLAVLADAATLLTIPAAVAALIAAATGLRTVRLLAAAAAGWIALVAVMAQAGYAGNPRYLVAAAAVGAVLAGVGAARLGATAHRFLARRDEVVSGRGDVVTGRGAVVAGIVVVVAAGLVALPDLRDQDREVGVRADRRAALPGLIAGAGGREAVLRCDRVRTAPDMRPLVAWELDVPMLNLDRRPVKPAVVLRWRPHYAGPVEPVMDPAREGYRLLARAPGWEAWDACG